jgi:hypothetical protein
MEMTVIEKERGQTVIKVRLNIKDVDTNEVLTLTGEVVQGNLLGFLGDMNQTRSAAAAIVGRMITRWKMNLIEDIEVAMIQAVRDHLMQLHHQEAGGAGRGGTVEEVPAIHIADDGYPTP